MKSLKEIYRDLLWKFIFKPVLAEANAAQAAQIVELNTRVTRLENRLLSYYTNRWDAIDNLADYLVGAEIPGDYFEFGVYKGSTFAYAGRLMAPLFKDMRFVALDSFEGLPEPQGADAVQGYSSGFYKGQYAVNPEEFRVNLQREGVDLNRVVLVKGWFDQSLNADMMQSHELSKIAAAWIDCDLYESTVPVLRFITPYLSQGSVLLFDDWRCFRNLPDRGQQRACQEWLQVNPQVELHEFISFGFHGQAFTVGSC
jgi:hypothetical protein